MHKSKKSYKNIIFDLGNVLLRWEPIEFITDFFRNEEKQKLDLLKNEILSISATNDWVEFDRGTISQKQLVQKLPSNFHKQEINYFLNNLPNYLTPIEERIIILKKIKEQGYKTYILSNFAKELFNPIFLRNDFFNFFDGMIISHQVHTVKPEPEIYRLLLQKYNLTPTTCLFIDDLQKNIDGAKFFGIDGIVCTNHEYLLKGLKKRKILE